MPRFGGSHQKVCGLRVSIGILNGLCVGGGQRRTIVTLYTLATIKTKYGTFETFVVLSCFIVINFNERCLFLFSYTKLHIYL